MFDKSRRRHLRLLSLLVLWVVAQARSAAPQVANRNAAPAKAEKVVIDTDIGDDIDDAFALALALRSPELEILQINSDFGNTPLRTRLLVRFLDAAGRTDIPVATGVRTAMVDRNFTQRPYAEREKNDDGPRLDAVDSTLALIHKYPGEITLITIGPLVNVGAMIEKDPNTFRKLKRVVMMGGSICAPDGDGSNCEHGPAPEWNILQCIQGAQELFASGVPIYMMPLDSTRLKLDEVKRESLFRAGTALTDQLVILYHQWGYPTPILWDAMPVSFATDPGFCPTRPMRISVDEAGNTRVQPGPPNANVCLRSDSQKFFEFYMSRLVRPGN